MSWEKKFSAVREREPGWNIPRQNAQVWVENASTNRPTIELKFFW